MADINVERKGPSIWPWIIGLIVLALLIWALMELLGDDEPEVAAVEPAVPAVVAPPEPIAQGPLCVGQVLDNPTAFVGQTLGECEVRVTEVVSDRGFFIEEAGQRVFVIINEGTQQNPEPGVADVQGRTAEQPWVNAGQSALIREAVVMNSVANVNPPLDEQTQAIASQQPWFLVTDGRNIQVSGAQPNM